jgi:hypothetical protein
MEPDTIEKMVRFRIDHPEYFIVSPLVINNALCTYIMQNTGKIRLSEYCSTDNEVIWRNGLFAARLHDWFYGQLSNRQYENLHCGIYPVGMKRLSINAILWFGSEMKKFSGIVPGDDEEWLSVIKPTESGVSNCINGGTIAVHFAFFPQRKYLDKKKILERYGKYLLEEWKKDAVSHNVCNIVQDAMNEVEEKKAIILAKPDIYSAVPFKKRLKNMIAKWKVPIPRLYTLGYVKNLLLMNRLKISDK